MARRARAGRGMSARGSQASGRPRAGSDRLHARPARSRGPLARRAQGLLDEAVFVGVAPGSCSRCRAAADLNPSPSVPARCPPPTQPSWPANSAGAQRAVPERRPARKKRGRAARADYGLSQRGGIRETRRRGRGMEFHSMQVHSSSGGRPTRPVRFLECSSFCSE